MKKVSELNIPDNCFFTADHEWVRQEGDICVVGISDFAQDQLGDVVFVDLPCLDESLEQGDEFGSVESVKAVSELLLPISGEVVEINENLEEDPEKVNTDPYQEGWMIKIKPSDISQLQGLKDAAAYRVALGEGE